MTRKPCPCCKEVANTRKADDICYECREKIDSVEILKSLLAEQQEKSNFSMPVLLGPASHWNKYLSLPGNKGSRSRELQKIFFELAQAVSIQSFEMHNSKETTPLLGKIEGYSYPEAHRLINPEVAKWIMELHAIIEPLARELYAEGQADAKDIIEKFNEIRKLVQ